MAVELALLQEGAQARIYLLVEGGSCPAADFLEECQMDHPDELAKLQALLDRACEHGPPKNREKVNTLGDGLFEFKTGGGLRLLWFWDAGRMVLCTHGFVKKQQKTPKGELSRAHRMKVAYEAAKRAGSIKETTL